MAAFAPVCWSANKFTGTAPYDDWYTGDWRSSGTGMIAFYASDFYAAGGCVPLADRSQYGREDHEFSMMLKSSGQVQLKRSCTPELWHLYHSMALWGASVNGMRTPRGSMGTASPGTKAANETAKSGAGKKAVKLKAGLGGKDGASGEGDSDSAGEEAPVEAGGWKLPMPRDNGPHEIQTRLGARLDGYRCTRLLSHVYV